MRTRKYRRPDQLPKLRKLPKIGDLCFIVDLDGEIFPLIVLEIVYELTKKGKPTKKVLAVNVLSGNTVYNTQRHDLRTSPRYITE